jgi:DNA-binding MarR family transcriptional regulator
VKQREHYRQILRLVHGISRLVNPQHLPVLKERSISLNQFLVLDALAGQGATVRMFQLASLCGLQPNELTRVVKTLEERRWLRRTTDREDSRAKQVGLTTSGARTIRKVHDQATAELSAVWEDFTHEEWHRFINYLSRFEQGVRRTRGEGDDPVSTPTPAKARQETL